MLFMKKFMVLLVVLMSSAFAYELAINVTVAQGTAGAGTNVSIVQNGVVLFSAKADTGGVARFNVSAGEYFVLLNRLSYPTYVSLVSVEKNTSYLLTMSQGLSYASAYGQVSGPSDFGNATVIALRDGQLSEREYPSAAGNYLIQFLQEGNYQLVFTVPGFEGKNAEVFLPKGQFTQINIALEKAAVLENITVPPVLTAPSQIAQLSVIEVSLSQNGIPLSGQEIIVQTPSGAATLTTNNDGKAYINAAEGGAYSFSYGALFASTTAIPKAAPQQNATPPAQEEPPAQPPAQPPSSQQGGLSIAALALIAIGAIALGAAIGAVYIFMEQRNKHRKQKEAKQPAPVEGQPHHEAPASPRGEGAPFSAGKSGKKAHKHGHKHSNK